MNMSYAVPFPLNHYTPGASKSAELELWRAIKNGCSQAWNEVFQRLQKPVTAAVCQRLCDTHKKQMVESCVQSAFATMFRKYAVDRKMPLHATDLDGMVKLATRYAWNKARTRIRRICQQHNQERLVDLHAHLQMTTRSDELGPLEQLILREDEQAIKDACVLALGRFKSRRIDLEMFREAIYAKLEGKTTAQIAEKLGVQPRTITRWLQRFIDLLNVEISGGRDRAT
ncbi:MAG: helix-turn-helix domain-containing protein [Sedimentisphaerales bacterium]|nr:helix-turn-helix domain-containing protein [Sedimentisphaerales bacterium]